MSTLKIATLSTLQAFKTEADKAYNYTIKKADTASSGALATYQLYKGDKAVGAVIDIPKDYLVKSASVKTATAADTPLQGLAAGDKYIDFVINTANGDGNESHIYLAVKDIVTAYAAGNGVELSADHKFSVKIGTANGLSVDSNGLNLAAASTTASGAMSASDKSKLDGIEAGAKAGTVKSVTAGVGLTTATGNAITDTDTVKVKLKSETALTDDAGTGKLYPVAVDKSGNLAVNVPWTDNNDNTTYTLTQDTSDGHKITFTPSNGTATTITIPDTDTTYSAATTSADGLMSKEDKAKLNNCTVADDFVEITAAEVQALFA